MIKASELRIGNIVFNEYSGVSVVESVTVRHIEYRALQGSMTGLDYIHSFTPIPLTEEWLVRMGFECVYKSNIHSCYSIGRGTLSYYFWYNDKRKYASIQGTPFLCPHVHQLQKLYFALSGEELEIKEADK